MYNSWHIINIQQMSVAVVQESDTLRKYDGGREGGHGFLCLPCFVAWVNCACHEEATGCQFVL